MVGTGGRAALLRAAVGTKSGATHLLSILLSGAESSISVGGSVSFFAHTREDRRE